MPHCFTLIRAFDISHDQDEVQRAQRNKNAGALIERKLAILDRALGMDGGPDGVGGSHGAADRDSRTFSSPHSVFTKSKNKMNSVGEFFRYSFE
jgi:hypothetical protein